LGLHEPEKLNQAGGKRGNHLGGVAILNLVVGAVVLGHHLQVRWQLLIGMREVGIYTAS
jgi:hypothetical protein